MSPELNPPVQEVTPPDAPAYLRALRRGSPVILAAALLAASGAYVLSERVLPRVYESNVLLIIIPGEGSSEGLRSHPGLNAYVPDQSISETFRQLAGSTTIVSAASSDLEIPAPQLRSQVSTQAVQRTPLLRLTARAPDSRGASRIAQGYASAFVRLAESQDWVPGAEIQMASPAAAGGTQVAPRTLVNTVVAAVVALLLAVTAVMAAARFGRLGRARRPKRAPAACPKAGHSRGTGRAA